jgi:hypothetical protein
MAKGNNFRAEAAKKVTAKQAKTIASENTEKQLLRNFVLPVEDGTKLELTKVFGAAEWHTDDKSGASLSVYVKVNGTELSMPLPFSQLRTATLRIDGEVKVYKSVFPEWATDTEILTAIEKGQITSVYYRVLYFFPSEYSIKARKVAYTELELTEDEEPAAEEA